MAGSTKGKWVRRSESEWRALLSRFERGDVGVEAFCRREGISAASFYRRRRGMLGDDMGRASGGGKDRPAAFVDLGPLSAAPAGRLQLDLRLDLGEGLVLHLVRR